LFLNEWDLQVVFKVCPLVTYMTSFVSLHACTCLMFWDCILKFVMAYQNRLNLQKQFQWGHHPKQV
jgi:hypothetical protein